MLQLIKTHIYYQQGNKRKSAQRDHFQLNVAEIEFNPGDIVALIGANGSGKTTLIEAMLGLINTETRDMTMFGQPVSAFDSNLALKERIGVQLQKSSFSQRLKVAEIVKMHHLFYDRISPQSFEQLRTKPTPSRSSQDDHSACSGVL